MMDRRDGEDAIRKLDDSEFGYKRRRLKVQWAKVGGGAGNMHTTQ